MDAAAGSRGPKRPTEVVKVIDVGRANNVSIMLTQFAAFKGGALEVRHAILRGSKQLGLDRLGLLLQVCLNWVSLATAPLHPHPAVSCTS